ncbi:hypothetical protein [Thalassotalea ganghwensis]
MSPEQLAKLRQLSELFEQGSAGPEQIKELSELLAVINHLHDESPHFETAVNFTKL